ncbi:MAG: 4-hydroxy-tetrahydrodipicolinate reductase [Candidatus Aenigmarchaeota archaeon]|nr:4-hydroxy-tetrahydrodipicolinate reductase [Candidatus Aenigmarchaeota archaeon]
MTIKVALGGYGRMGKIAESYFASDPDIEIVYGVTRNPPTRNSGQFPIYPPEVLLSGDLPTVDMWLDFSRPGGAMQNIPTVVKKRIKPIIGTTGFATEEQQYLRNVLEESGIPCFWDSNFSLGVNVMAYLVEQATKSLQGYDVEVGERHHNRKRDGPSGTELNILFNAIRRVREEATETYREPTKDHLRRLEEVGLSYQRAGDNPGRHEVVFGGNREELVISHQVFEPVVFVGGAKTAILWLYEQNTSGIYRFRDILGI